MDRVIEVKDLRFAYKAFPEREVLKGVTMEVRRGEFLGLVGPSPSGKTTLLLSFVGLVPKYFKGRYSGEVRLLGKNVLEMRKREIFSRVGVVFQDPETQILENRVLDEIAFPLENLGLEREEIEQRIREVSKALRIEHLLDRETCELSGGEKQKVAIAAALVTNPEILILDEPTTDLDPPSVKSLYEFLRRLTDSGKTVVVAEKKVQWVEKFADRILEVRDGKVLEYSPDPLQISPRQRKRQRKEEVVIRVKDVEFEYPGGIRALRGVSLEVVRGEILAILGPNGSGKTTLLKCLVGLLKPKKGAVWIKGVNEIKPSRVCQKVGFLFQNPNHQVFCDTVWEEVAFYLKQRSQYSEERVRQYLRLVGLEEKAAWPPDLLSGGEKQRLILASLLAMGAEILVMDEPTTSLDNENVRKLAEILLDLAEKGVTIIFSTHRPEIAEKIADRIIFMKEGRIVGVSTSVQEISWEYCAA